MNLKKRQELFSFAKYKGGNKEIMEFSSITPKVKSESLLEYDLTFWSEEFIQTTLIPNAKISSGSKILLAGCDVGSLGRLIAKNIPNVEIVGVDESSSALEVGKDLNAHKKINNIHY
ncbi:hypothetical protein FZW96_11200 [Bacillus sp. BGMRC 2118]|nr:hypothetical protein FZW96_11200 [Bacillus sp. BGMRC 2118]